MNGTGGTRVSLGTLCQLGVLADHGQTRVLGYENPPDDGSPNIDGALKCWSYS